MATVLNRLGRFAFRKRYGFVALWLGILATMIAAAATGPAAAPDVFTIPDSESQRAADLLAERFPGTTPGAAQARIVFTAPEGRRISAAPYPDAVADILAGVRAGAQVQRVSDPFRSGGVSADGGTAYATVTYAVTSADVTDGARAALTAAVAAGAAAGITVDVGGTALRSPPEVGAASEVIGIVVAAIVLMITFGALAAAAVPLVTALIGIGVSVGALVAIGMSGTTITLATMLGLAVGIDYALFILARYRGERAAGFAPEEAVGRAVATAGSAVVFAGLTVLIALCGLAVVGIPALTRMGVAAAGAVAVAVAIAVTLLPALLGFTHRAVMPRAYRWVETSAAHGPDDVKLVGQAMVRWKRRSASARWAEFVSRRPVPVLLVGIAATALLALPVRGLDLGMPSDGSLPPSTTQRQAYDTIAARFGPGFDGPLTVVVDVVGAPDPQAAVTQAGAMLAATPDVVSVSPAVLDPAGRTAVFTVIPATGPSSAETGQVVRAVRAEAGHLKTATGSTMMVTGATAVAIDFSQRVTSALGPYLAVLAGLAMVMLTMVFASVAVPIKATLGFLLSVGAALGLVVMVFQWGWLAGLFGVEQTGPVLSIMPIFLIGVVFGLAMDYEIFLVTRIREAFAHGASAREAIVTGFRHSARVVAAAAAIMIAVFAGFAGSDDPMIQMMGFGLAAAVFLDAFVIRMTLVPAVLALLGDRAWWMPRWLARIVPKVEVEGSDEARAGRA
ncbi:MMPL family transporter [Nocardia sp. IFM 10818]